MSAETPSQRESLEAALVADPDDTTAYMAYADLLAEEGDPRGDFARVQLALESTPDGPERDALLEREQALLAEHAEEWLGSLAWALHDNDDARYRFRRGWLDEIQVPSIREGLAEEIANAPEIRLLRKFRVISPDARELDPAEAYQTHVLVGSAWFEDDEEVALVPLLASPYLGNLRVFQLGDPDHERCDVGDGPVADLIEKMPRIEELHLFLWKLSDAERILAMPLPHLKVLRVGGVFSQPIGVVAQNESLGALEDLMFQSASPGGHSKQWPDECAELVRSPHLKSLKHLRVPFLTSGDVLCEAIVESGILARLKTLELGYSQITDAGAATLAASPDLAKLERLDLTGNNLTPEGIERLRATGVTLLWEPQTVAEEVAAEGEEAPSEDEPAE